MSLSTFCEVNISYMSCILIVKVISVTKLLYPVILSCNFLYLWQICNGLLFLN